MAMNHDAMTTIAVSFASKNSFGRYADLSSNNVLNQLDAIAAVVDTVSSMDASEVRTVTINEHRAGFTVARNVTYTNICGKILHCGSRYCYRETVQPFVQTIQNGFGTFRGLFGMKCNLVLCGSDKCTLFRGAIASADIDSMIQHAMFPENIQEVCVHMLCATFRVGKPIMASKNDLLVQGLTQNPHWSGRMLMQTEEKAYMVSFKLDKFDQQWLANTMQAPEVNSMLVNINLKGSVNLFLAVDSCTPFYVGVEDKFKPLLEHIRETIANTT